MGIKINEPIGRNVWAPFLIRLALGAYFIMAGMGKLEVLAAFIDQVKSFGILPANVASLYATLLPYGEVAIGGLMLIGLWTTLTGILSGLLIFSFVLAFGFFPGGHDIFNKDLILCAAACSLLFSGPGVYALDNIRRVAPAT
ncbi:MAG: hypothetical protein RL518_999 [Pseudomonadota bacterium]|jgi:uncharacterized membrane protein YphA (DoxX/SURF4 family)